MTNVNESETAEQTTNKKGLQKVIKTPPEHSEHFLSEYLRDTEAELSSSNVHINAFVRCCFHEFLHVVSPQNEKREEEFVTQEI